MMNSTQVADRAWLARCDDFEQFVLKNKTPRFSRFITPHEAEVLRTQFRPSPFVQVMTWGGCEENERVMAGFFPDFTVPSEEDFPIGALRVCGVSGLSHRDILGSVMGLGIKREMIGDIFLDQDTADVLLDDAVLDFVQSELEYIGRKKVKTMLCPKNVQRQLVPHFSYERRVVSSLRADAVLSAAFGLSRGEALRQIDREFMQLNHCVCTDGAKRVSAGDVISLRHHGKFVIDEVMGETKKGRISVLLKKYI